MRRKKIMLRISQTAGVTDGGVTAKFYVSKTPAHPRKWYEVLRPGGAPLGWVNGDLWFGLPVNYDTGNETGTAEWSITAEPGLVPGRLQVAHWLTTSDPDTDPPDQLDSYDLHTGAWDSGPLSRGTYDGTADPVEFPPYLTTRVRFIPKNLLYLLD
jgi:hypothetical protein